MNLINSIEGAANTVYGEDADSKIIAEVAKKKYISADGCYIYDPDSDSEELLFYDSFLKDILHLLCPRF